MEKNVYDYEERMDIQEAINFVIKHEEYDTLRFPEGTFTSKGACFVSGPITIQGTGDLCTKFDFPLVCYGESTIQIVSIDFEAGNKGLIYLTGDPKKLILRNSRLRTKSRISIGSILFDLGKLFLYLPIENGWVSADNLCTIESFNYEKAIAVIRRRVRSTDYTVRCYDCDLLGDTDIDLRMI